MAAWTWVRFSCPRDVTVSEFYTGVDESALHPLPGTPPHPLEGEYVRLRGVVAHVMRVKATSYYAGFRSCWVADGPERDRIVEVLLPATWRAEAAKKWASPEAWEKGVVGANAVFIGRFVRHHGELTTMNIPSIQHAVVDTTASRFHPASVAGLVVGAMGMLVFSLYLRRWVIARRTAPESKTP
jgi:hypothetical protein